MIDSSQLLVHVSPAVDGDQDDVAGLASRLRAELLDLDVDTVEPLTEDNLPEGTKGLATLAGALVVRLGGAGLNTVLTTVRDWVLRNGRTVEATIDGDTIKLTNATREQQRAVLDAWLARHEASSAATLSNLGNAYLAEDAGGNAPRDTAFSNPPVALGAETIPVVVYLDNEAPAMRVERALNEVLTEFGLQTVHREPPVVRSWFHRMTAKFERPDGPEVTRRLMRELDRAVELRAVEQIQAQVDAAQGDVVAKLLTALADTANALIQIGSVLLIKVDGVPLVRNLTHAELAYLQRNPQLSQDPAACLRVLQQMVDHANQNGRAAAQTDEPALTAQASSVGEEPTQQSPGSTRPTN